LVMSNMERLSTKSAKKGLGLKGLFFIVIPPFYFEEPLLKKHLGGWWANQNGSLKKNKNKNKTKIELRRQPSN
jgi:hypothetical protein